MKIKIIVPIIILMAIFIASIDSSTAQPVIFEPIGLGENAIGLGENAIRLDLGEVLKQEQLGEVRVGEVPSVGCFMTNASGFNNTCT